MNEAERKIQLERYNNAMKELDSLKSPNAQDVLESHYQKVHNANVKKQNMRDISDLQFDLGLAKYGEETNSGIEKDLVKRIKYYKELDTDKGQLQKDANLADKINKEILERKQKRERGIKEKKDREKREKEQEIEDGERAKREKEAVMLAESNIRVAIQKAKTAKAKSKARKLERNYSFNKQMERDEMERKKEAKKGVAYEIKEQNRRKAIDRGILTKEEFDIKYP